MAKSEFELSSFFGVYGLYLGTFWQKRGIVDTADHVRLPFMMMLEGRISGWHNKGSTHGQILSRLTKGTQHIVLIVALRLRVACRSVMLRRKGDNLSFEIET